LRRFETKAYPLASLHELEAVEIGHLNTTSLGGKVLRPGSLLPCTLNVGLVPGIDEASSPLGSVDINLQIGQRNSLQIDDLTLDIVGRTIDLNLLNNEGGKYRFVSRVPARIVPQAPPTSFQ
tara:strand:- start:1334 stop:1699 length:366 start_codon:yes stop_codon:yes gene_type:complete